MTEWWGSNLIDAHFVFVARGAARAFIDVAASLSCAFPEVIAHARKAAVCVGAARIDIAIVEAGIDAFVDIGATASIAGVACVTCTGKAADRIAAGCICAAIVCHRAAFIDVHAGGAIELESSITRAGVGGRSPLCTCAAAAGARCTFIDIGAGASIEAEARRTGTVVASAGIAAGAHAADAWRFGAFIDVRAGGAAWWDCES